MMTEARRWPLIAMNAPAMTQSAVAPRALAKPWAPPSCTANKMRMAAVRAAGVRSCMCSVSGSPRVERLVPGRIVTAQDKAMRHERSTKKLAGARRKARNTVAVGIGASWW